MTDKPKVTVSGRPPELPLDSAAPAPIDPSTGQHRDYWVLPAEERAKGFIRPVRTSYQHVGPMGPTYQTRPLTAEEHERYDSIGHYVAFEMYPPNDDGELGRFWTQAQLDAAGKGCGTITSMRNAIAETYARQPWYYGATFCCGCGKHLPVGLDGEFVWEGTDERVGT